jgi:hypothetical protein
VGHIKLTAFNARALSDVAESVRQLEAEGASELVLDLRDNRGGLVQEGIEIANLFLNGARLPWIWRKGCARRVIPISGPSLKNATPHKKAASQKSLGLYPRQSGMPPPFPDGSVMAGRDQLAEPWTDVH